MPPTHAPPPDERLGSLFLLSDIAIMTMANLIVKASGATYPVAQLIFIRALVGFVLVLPSLATIWRQVVRPGNVRLHLIRVSLGVLSLVTNYAAVVALPLALAVTISFLRPLAMLVAAALFLGETVSLLGWIAALLGFVGVVIAAEPGAGASWQGVGIALLNVLLGTMAIITVRKLASASRPLLMVYYTMGLSLLSGPFAIQAWVPVAAPDWPLLVGLGCLAQVGQFCFLKAHQLASTERLANLSYLQIVSSGLAAYFVFHEIPSLRMVAGAIIIVAAAALASRAKPTSNGENPS